MIAIIYIAGSAGRLALRDKAHKILLEFGGETLLERHVKLLRSVGVEQMGIVTGHAADAVRATFADLQKRHGVRISEFYNPDYREGSILSMCASLPALRAIRDHALLMDGDVLYDRRMLARLVESPHRTVLLLDRDYSKQDEDPVLVPVKNGRPFEMQKLWKGSADWVGESIGFFKVAGPEVQEIVKELEARSQAGIRHQSYDDVLRAMVQRGLFAAEDVTGLPWTEIDFPYDLEFARNVVFPALKDA
jgi:choline kinase